MNASARTLTSFLLAVPRRTQAASAPSDRNNARLALRTYANSSTRLASGRSLNPPLRT
jgi:hypothetical protein